MSEQPTRERPHGQKHTQKERIPDELRLHEDDAELEREYRALAQWLIDVYLWRQHESHKSNPQADVDKDSIETTL